jgi:ABC-type branched-subunit amino acid transport system substrate-binding protein
MRMKHLAGVLLLVWPLAAAAQELVLGQVAPLTGTIAETGNEYVAGAAAYFAHVNEQGGVNGRKIRVVVKDDGYKPDETLRLTQQLLEQEKPIALFGFVGTANIAALNKAEVLGKNNIALLAPYTGATSVRQPVVPQLFHIRASYSDETAKMVEHLATIGVKRVAVFYQDDPFGTSGLVGATEAMKRINTAPVATGSYDRTKPDEVDKAVAAISAANPDAVIAVSVNRATAALIRKMRAAGQNAQIFSISVVNFKELIKNTGEALTRGVGIAQVMPFPYGGGQPVVREFHALMKKHAPDKVISYASMESFIAAKVMVEALRRAGPNPSREKVLKSLEALRDYDAGGFTVSFSPQTRVGSNFVEVTVIGPGAKLIR